MNLCLFNPQVAQTCGWTSIFLKRFVADGIVLVFVFCCCCCVFWFVCCRSKLVPLSNISIASLPTFSLPLVLNQLTSSMLLSLALLAGYLDQYNIPDLLQQAHAGVAISTDNKVLMLLVCMHVYMPSQAGRGSPSACVWVATMILYLHIIWWAVFVRSKQNSWPYLEVNVNAICRGRVWKGNELPWKGKNERKVTTTLAICNNIEFYACRYSRVVCFFV